MCVCGGGVVCISGGEGSRVSTLTVSFSQSRESRGLPGMVAHGTVSMWYHVSAHLQELSHFLTSLYQGISMLFQSILSPGSSESSTSPCSKSGDCRSHPSHSFQLQAKNMDKMFWPPPKPTTSTLRAKHCVN